VFSLRKRPIQSPSHPRPLEIHLVRHAQALNDDGVDTHGPELTLLGHRQARRLAKRLSRERYAAIYCSDLTRARQTAEAIARHHADELPTVTRDLREVSSIHTALEMSRLSVHNDRSITEELDAMQRVTHHLHFSHHPGECILVVSHGNITRIMIPMLGAVDPVNAPLFEIYNASLSKVELWPSGRAVVRLVNCVAHLPESMIT